MNVDKNNLNSVILDFIVLIVVLETIIIRTFEQKNQLINTIIF